MFSVDGYRLQRLDPKSSPALDDVTLQTPMNLVNKEEASRLHALTTRFSSGLRSILFPAGLQMTLSVTYAADPLSPDKIISTSQKTTNTEEAEMVLTPRWWDCHNSEPGRTRGQTSVDLVICEPLLPRILYPTTVLLSSRKTPLLPTGLPSHKAQCFNFPTDSILLISLLSHGKNSSLQPEGDPPRSETKLHLFLGRQMFSADNSVDNFLKRRGGKRGRGENISLSFSYFLPFPSFSNSHD